MQSKRKKRPKRRPLNFPDSLDFFYISYINSNVSFGVSVMLSEVEAEGWLALHTLRLRSG